MSASIFDDRRCTLGEGPLWHPERRQFFWFDITAHKLMSRGSDGPQHWDFDEPVSAAGWTGRDSLLIASASGLWQFSLTDGARSLVAPLERDMPGTRSNDGRADPWGGFWIGTMGRNGESRAGAIYRLYQGQLRKLFAQITISNAICFAPGRGHAYFADSFAQRVMRVALDRAGWPAGKPDIFIDMRAEDRNPDGAVTDADGTLWIAQWGAGRVAAYAPDGRFLRAVDLPARHTSCPAFGGADLRRLYVTSALQGLSDETLAAEPTNGMTFAVDDLAQGLPEPKVLI